MTRETKQLARTERLLRDLSELFGAIEAQQVRGQRHELTGAVPVSLHDFAHGIKHEIDALLDPLGASA